MVIAIRHPGEADHWIPFRSRAVVAHWLRRFPLALPDLSVCSYGVEEDIRLSTAGREYQEPVLMFIGPNYVDRVARSSSHFAAFEKVKGDLHFFRAGLSIQGHPSPE